MPSLSYYLRRTKEQSFRETVNLARQVMAERMRMAVQPAYDRLLNSAPSKDDVLRRTGAPSWETLAANLKSRSAPQLFELPRIDPTGVFADKLIGRPLQWHTDVMYGSGYTWDSDVHYRRIVLSPKPGVDIKGPWELSRFHEGLHFGQAYQRTSDEKYAEEFVRRVKDWIAQNPYRYGVNWTSAMEAGIRAANWACAFYLVRGARAVNAEFISEFVSSLNLHARFIKSNLEYREAWIEGRRRRINSNHYLCDLAGLLFIAVLFPELQLNEDRKFATAELERELFEQTHEDGADYEHSITYHRFVLEIFTASFELMRTNGISISSQVDDRLALMRRFLSSCTQPDTGIPQIGDNDDGHFLPMAQVLPDAENISRDFPDAGFFIMRGPDTHVIVSAARVGMRGFGSHSHNDILSFEYWHAGASWIVDPGTYVYLPDPETRNWFRSTEAHNTVRIDETEINPFHPESIFQMADVAQVRIDSWTTGDTGDVLEAHHTGYSRLPGNVRHTRRFELDKASGRLVIKDVIAGTGAHLMEWFYQIHPLVGIQRDGSAFVLTARYGAKRLKVDIQGPGVAASVTKGWYSPTYSMREPSNRIFALLHAPLPQTVTTVIEPC